MTPSQTPTVAVIVAAYNAGETITRAVQSALAEPEVSEVWVVDDASTDDTLERAALCDNPAGRLRLVRQERNAGPAAARNRALEGVTADWVCVLDSDDFFLEGRIGRLLAHASKADLIADDLIRVQDPALAALPKTVAADTAPRLIGLADFIDGNISRRGRDRQELGFIKPLMRRSVLEQNRLRYDERLRLGEDFHLYACALAKGARLLLLPPMGYVAVRRADSLSGRHSVHDLEALRDSGRSISEVRPLSRDERRLMRAHYVSVDKRLQWRRLIEAVKARNAGGVMSTFTSLPVAVELAVQLLGQAWRRTLGGN